MFPNRKIDCCVKCGVGPSVSYEVKLVAEIDDLRDIYMRDRSPSGLVVYTPMEFPDRLLDPSVPPMWRDMCFSVFVGMEVYTKVEVEGVCMCVKEEEVVECSPSLIETGEKLSPFTEFNPNQVYSCCDKVEVLSTTEVRIGSPCCGPLNDKWVGVVASAQGLITEIVDVPSDDESDCSLDEIVSADDDGFCGGVNELYIRLYTNGFRCGVLNGGTCDCEYAPKVINLCELEEGFDPGDEVVVVDVNKMTGLLIPSALMRDWINPLRDMDDVFDRWYRTLCIVTGYAKPRLRGLLKRSRRIWWRDRVAAYLTRLKDRVREYGNSGYRIVQIVNFLLTLMCCYHVRDERDTSKRKGGPEPLKFA